MLSGFISLHRSILDWEWYHDTNVRLLFIHCLLSANFKDGKFEGKVIQRGSFVTSLQHLSDGCGLTVQQTRTALKKLSDTNEITRTSTAKYTVISIAKFNDFQDVNNKITINQQSINNETTINQQQYNKGNKDNIYPPIVPPNGISKKQKKYPDKFEAFWKAYPKRSGTNPKTLAMKKFDRAVNAGADPTEIISGVQRYAAHCDASGKTGTEFVQQAQNWLNQEGWKDEYSISKAPNSGNPPNPDKYKNPVVLGGSGQLAEMAVCDQSTSNQPGSAVSSRIFELDHGEFKAV